MYFNFDYQISDLVNVIFIVPVKKNMQQYRGERLGIINFFVSFM